MRFFCISILVLFLGLFSFGCDTLSDSVENSSAEGDIPSAEEFILDDLREWVGSERAKSGEFFICDTLPNNNGYEYTLAQFIGEGATMHLYKYRELDGSYEIADIFYGEFAISGGMIINVLPYENGYLLFGNINQTHWDPATDLANPFDPDKIVFYSDTKTVEKNVNRKTGYVVALPSQLNDFAVFDKSGNMILDKKTYVMQGYIINRAVD
jgi:hypothetical protein